MIHEEGVKYTEPFNALFSGEHASLRVRFAIQSKARS